MLDWLPGESRHPRYREVWALRDVSFELKRGRCLGVIGSNGSGKSTLLKILTGVAQPTTGTVSVKGRVLSLLELGTGFNPELTGRQNVVASASLMGLPPDFAAERMGDIAAFADIGVHFDHPVRTYSSGMFVRLAFATYMHMEPELFIVDEALSVGDLFFQQKCAVAMRNLRARGVTLLFASHDMTAVQELCDEAILLDRGHVAAHGIPTQTITRYLAIQGERQSKAVSAARQPSPASTPTSQDAGAEKAVAEKAAAGETAAEGAGSETGLPALIRRDDLLQGRRGTGVGGCLIPALRLIDRQGNPVGQARCGMELGIQALIRAQGDVEEPNFGIDLVDPQGRSVMSVGSSNRDVWIGPLGAGEERVVTAWLRLAVPPGRYRLSVAVGECRRLDPYHAVFHDLYPEFTELDVLPDDGAAMFDGVADIGIAVETFAMENRCAARVEPT
nr:ABC transporter ATP-binding protein [Azospirillum formosense]